MSELKDEQPSRLIRAAAIARRLWAHPAGKTIFGLATLLLLVSLISATFPGFRGGNAPIKQDAAGDGTIAPSWAVESEMHAFVMEFQQKIPTLAGRVDDLAETQTQNQAETREALAEILRRLGRMEDAGAEPPPATAEEPMTHVPLLQWRRQDKEAPAAEVDDARITVVPATSEVHGTLRHGLFADLDETVPAIIQLNSIVLGPNSSQINLQRAGLVGRAQGSAGKSLITIDVTRLAYVDPTGRAHEVPVSGRVQTLQRSIEDPEKTTWRDGIPAVYVERWDRLWPVMIAAGISNMAEVFRLSKQRVNVGVLGNQTIDFRGEEFTAAGFSAVGGAADEFAKIMTERVRDMKPAMACDGGIKVRVAFDNGFSIRVPPEVIQSLKEDPYDALDSRAYRRP